MSYSGIVENVTALRNATVPNVVMKDTPGGYEIRTEAPISDRAILIERMSAITGFTMIAVALTGIYFAKTSPLAELSAVQMAAGATVLTGGIAYLWIAIRGTRHQVNLDLEKQELHYVVRNHTDGLRVLKSVRFAEIDSTYIKRAEADGKPAILYARLSDGEDLIEIARGAEEDLQPVQARIARDLPQRAGFIAEVTDDKVTNDKAMRPAA